MHEPTRSLSVRYTDSRYHFPTDFAGVPSDSNQSSAEEMLTFAADVGRRLGDAVRSPPHGRREPHRRRVRRSPDNRGDTLGFGFASQRDSRADRGNLDARINGVLSPALTVTAGAQVERETERQSGETTSNFGGIATTPDTPFDRDRTTFGYYAQGAARSGVGSGPQPQRSGGRQQRVRHLLHLSRRSRLPPAFGTRIRASLGRSFKAPTFCEQFCDAPFVVGDSTLQPGALDQLGGRYRAGVGRGRAVGLGHVLRSALP